MTLWGKVAKNATLLSKMILIKRIIINKVKKAKNLKNGRFTFLNQIGWKIWCFYRMHVYIHCNIPSLNSNWKFSVIVKNIQTFYRERQVAPVKSQDISSAPRRWQSTKFSNNDVKVNKSVALRLKSQQTRPDLGRICGCFPCWRKIYVYRMLLSKYDPLGTQYCLVEALLLSILKYMFP